MSLPSDNINEILRNSYNQQYLKFKSSRDENRLKLRNQAVKKANTIRDTHANKLKRDVQTANARKLEEMTD